MIDQVLSGTEHVVSDLEGGAIPFSGQVVRQTVKELKFRRRQVTAS